MFTEGASNARSSTRRVRYVHMVGARRRAYIRLEHVDEELEAVVARQIRSVQHEVRLLRLLVHAVDASEAAQLAVARAPVEALHVALLAHRQRRVHEHLEELEASRVVHCARPFSVLN